MARHRYAVQLRWSDMDVQSHVNNVQYLRFLEDARVQMLVHLGRPGQMMETGQVTVRHEIDYVAPLLFRVRPILVDTWVERIGRTSYVLGYEILDHDGTVFARARSVMVCIDPPTGTKVPIESGIRRGLKAYFDDGDVVDPTADQADQFGPHQTEPLPHPGAAADSGATLASVGGNRPDGAAAS